VLLGEKTYNSHESVYGARQIICGHCGSPLVVEVKTKRTKSGLHEYFYYRCAGYNRPGHPRIRLSESELDGQVLAFLGRLKFNDAALHDWFQGVLIARTSTGLEQSQKALTQLRKQLTEVKNQQAELLRLRIASEITSDDFSAMKAEIQAREANLKLQVEAAEQKHTKGTQVVHQVLHLVQTLPSRWSGMGVSAKRQTLDTLFTSLRLDGTSLVPTMRRPFDVLIGGSPSELAKAG